MPTLPIIVGQRHPFDRQHWEEEADASSQKEMQVTSLMKYCTKLGKDRLKLL